MRRPADCVKDRVMSDGQPRRQLFVSLKAMLYFFRVKGAGLARDIDKGLVSHGTQALEDVVCLVREGRGSSDRAQRLHCLLESRLGVRLAAMFR